MSWTALAGPAFQVLGGIVNQVAAKRAQEKMLRSFQDELGRQAGYRNQALNVFYPQIQQMGVETAREQMAQGEQNRVGEFNRVGQVPFSIGQPMGMGPSARDQANVGMSGQALAHLGGYSDWQLEQLIHQIRTKDELNKLVNFSQGEAGIFPLRMQDAQHSQDDLMALGSLFSSLGGAASGYDAYRNSLPSTGQQQRQSVINNYYGLQGA